MDRSSGATPSPIPGAGAAPGARSPGALMLGGGGGVGGGGVGGSPMRLPSLESPTPGAGGAADGGGGGGGGVVGGGPPSGAQPCRLASLKVSTAALFWRFAVFALPSCRHVRVSAFAKPGTERGQAVVLRPEEDRDERTLTLRADLACSWWCWRWWSRCVRVRQHQRGLRPRQRNQRRQRLLLRLTTTTTRRSRRWGRGWRGFAGADGAVRAAVGRRHGRLHSRAQALRGLPLLAACFGLFCQHALKRLMSLVELSSMPSTCLRWLSADQLFRRLLLTFPGTIACTLALNLLPKVDTRLRLKASAP
eukprot:COSAG04_NODE_1332_length_7195_cov_7.711105_3_plen_306_part_00